MVSGSLVHANSPMTRHAGASLQTYLDAYLPQIDGVAMMAGVVADHVGKLTNAQAVHERDRIFADKRPVTRLKHKTRDILTAKWIGPVEDDALDPRFGGCAHGPRHRPLVRVVARSDSLDV